MKITLAKAFRIRNKLKEELGKRLEEWRLSPKSWPLGETPSFRKSSGVRPDQIFDDIVFLEEVLLELNLAINVANQERAQEINLKINSVNDKLRFVESALSEILNQQDFTENYNRVTGEKVSIQMEHAVANSDQYRNLYNVLKAEKFSRETQLAEVNATTHVFLDRSIEGRDGSLGEIIEQILGLSL